MKKYVFLIALLAAVEGVAYAQYSGQLSPAPVLARGSSRLGGYVALYEDAFGVLGQYRHGLGGYTDIGLKFGFVDVDRTYNGGGGVLVALDPKYQVLETRLKDPFDLSLGGAMELLAIEDLTIFSFGFYGVGSYSFKLHNGNTLSPYGRLIMRIEHSDPSLGESDTEFDIAFHIGSTFEFRSRTEALAEIQMDPDNFGFFMGMNFGL
jgi:hypothetical protein